MKGALPFGAHMKRLMRVPPGLCPLRSPFVLEGHRRELPRQLAGALRPVGWIFGETRKHDRIELFRNRQFRARGRRLRNRLRVLEKELHRRVAVEDQLAREQPVHHAARRIDIRAVIEGPSAERLLRSDERRRSAHDVVRAECERGHLFGSGRLVNRLHDAEVQHLDEVVVFAVAAQENIGRLDVAVHQRDRFRFRKRMTYLAGHVNHALRRHGPELLHHLLRVQSFQELHDVVERPVVGDAEVKQIDRVRRAQARNRLRLALEAPRGFGLEHGRRAARTNELDRGRSRQQAMTCPPHLAHPAFTETFDKSVAAKLARLRKLVTQRKQRTSADVRCPHNHKKWKDEAGEEPCGVRLERSRVQGQRDHRHCHEPDEHWAPPLGSMMAEVQLA
jgi:hypothetical protein